MCVFVHACVCVGSPVQTALNSMQCQVAKYVYFNWVEPEQASHLRGERRFLSVVYRTLYAIYFDLPDL